MGEAIRRHDWRDSPLGPVEAWPDALKTTVALMLGSRFPQAIAWGPELITLHNDAFIPILGHKPSALGRPFSAVWAETWDEIRPIAEAALAGQATFIEDFPLVVERGGSPEQVYFTFCYSPIRDQTGRVVGLLDTVTETTANVAANQRLAFLDGLGRAVAEARDADAVLATTTRMVAEYLQLSNCAYADMDADADGFTIRGDWPRKGAPSIVGRYRLADFGRLAVERLSAGQPLVLTDTLRDLAPEAARTFEAIGIAATICMPLVKDGRLTGLMAIHDNLPRLWAETDLALIREVTERSWAHIERVRADAAVREAAAALAALNATLEQRVEDRSNRLAEAEAALRQSQKMEAVGQLTGGVAHDFNNLLTIIRSSVDFLRRPDLPEERRRRYMDAVSDTVDRAAKLTSQLLAFARRQTLKPEVFDVGRRLSGVADMVDTITGARIQVVTELPETPCFVRADLSQFETALVNMAVNARDAMDGQGTLTLRLACGRPLPPIRGHGGSPMPFAAVSLSDSGCGIEPALLERIFEPFFTTKEVGRGTGLGLSQVFGFAKQSGGDIEVTSAVGAGTTFTLYLPETEPDSEIRPPEREVPPAATAGCGGHVLVVEDNLEVGRFATQILQDLGYQTSWAVTAEEALDKLGPDAAGFDAVFSDVVMPGMGGLALARTLRRQIPHLPVVLASGYSHVLAEDDAHGFELLSKPYAAEQVGRLLRRVMARAARERS
ncbi:Blue-light-activated protein [Methylobacterium symbioticum]|uniref:histidine kinase n=3 Tax=Methylobacterium TaxID=407 RepID=A0A509EMH5_9HYPH|nr:Blue-light-activated protein [Methylobacterium symbioticum]